MKTITDLLKPYLTVVLLSVNGEESDYSEEFFGKMVKSLTERQVTSVLNLDTSMKSPYGFDKAKGNLGWVEAEIGEPKEGNKMLDQAFNDGVAGQEYQQLDDGNSMNVNLLDSVDKGSGLGDSIEKGGDQPSDLNKQILK